MLKKSKLLKAWLITGLLALVMGSTGVAADSVNIRLENTTGVGISSNSVMINNILVDFVATNPFDPSHPTTQTVAYNVSFVLDPVTLHLVPNLGSVAPSSACATLTVNVSSASTGTQATNPTPLSGAVVSVAGTSVTGTTNSSGVATLTGLSSGSVQVSVAATGYTSSSQTVTLSCTATNSIGMAMSPTTGAGSISANQVRIVLTWGTNPSDLDSHLTGPITATTDLTATTNRFHVYYANRTGSTSGVAVLDVDDVTSFGPETVTISPPSGSTTLRAGLYRYSVHHYSGSSTIAASPASVTLYMGSQQQQFSPPAPTTTIGTNTVWTVFELGVDSTGAITVYPVNTYTASVSASAVRSTETGYGDIERGVDWARLPGK